VSSSGQDSDIKLIEGLVSSYISKPSCIILLTVACETDFENQGAHRLAKEKDPEGRRTIGMSFFFHLSVLLIDFVMFCRCVDET
jgi:hypothetical protein